MMRTWTVGIAVVALSAAQAVAETPTSEWSYDNYVKGVAFASDCCEPECGASECCEPECGCCDDACCNDGCCDSCCGDACCGGACCGDACRGGCLGAVEALSLASLVGASDPWQVGGWTSAGYHDDNERLSRTPGDDLSFNSLPDQLNVQQQWFYLGYVADGSNGLGFGFRADAMYGLDASEAQSYGNTTSIAGVPAIFARGFGTYDSSWDHGSFGWAIPQAYGSVAYGDLTMKVGRFFTPVGYEVIPDTGNFFRTHSLTHYNSEPFGHTGVQADYAMSDTLSLMGGWALGYDTGFDQFLGGNLAMGGFTYRPADDISFNFSSCYGNFGWRSGGSDDSYSHHIVCIVSLTDNLKYVFQSDYLNVNSTSSAAGPTGFNNEDYGATNYLFYTLTDRLSIGGRQEWWKSNNVTGRANSFNNITGGVNYKLLANLMVRGEYRYDWSPAGDTFAPGYNEDIMTTDMILTY